jgi:hypothetical protein
VPCPYFSGTINGLQDNSTNSPSQFSVTLTNYSGGTFSVPLGTYNYNFGNSGGLKVLNGQIVDTDQTNGVEYWYGYLNSTDSYAFAFYGSSDFGTGYYQEAEGGIGGTIIYTAAASVPFDIPGGATIPAFGGLLALGAMRKARKSIASKTRLANPVCASVS